MTKPKSTRDSALASPAKKTAKKATKAPQKAKEREELVVFAFRLKPEERDLIHKAAGPAKASKFVRALTVAASRKDEDTVVKMVRAVEDPK